MPKDDTIVEASPYQSVGMKVKDAARYYGVSERTIRRWVEKGAVKARRVGDLKRPRVRIREE